MKTRYFDSHFSEIPTTITFDEAWCNGTGYFDNAVKMVKLPAGELATAIDPYGRKLILVGTRFGTCVFFERYARKDDSQDQVTIVSNTPDALRSLVTDGNIGYDEFSRLVTSFLNIGKAIERMYRIADKESSSISNAASNLAETPLAKLAKSQEKMTSVPEEVKYHLDKPGFNRHGGIKLN